MLLLEMGRTSEAQQYLNTNNSSCNPNTNPSMSQAQKERCFDQIQSEANFMANSNVRTEKAREGPRCDLLRKQADANKTLARLASELKFNQSSVDAYEQTADSLSRDNDCK